jgi:MoaA/NifB/PqqE/SkfB family radical SAM enzyme
MYYQIEVTTRCNYSCYYCAGRDMPQKDMSWETFMQVVDSIKVPASVVSLQGEGEPSLHPRFFEMAEHLISREHTPYTILNGSRIDAQALDRLFPKFGVSVDTIDEQLAEQIGRHNLPKVLSHMEMLLDVIHPKRITIMTVDMGQDLAQLRQWVKRQGFGRHVVQKLSPKADYARRYTVPVTDIRHQAQGPRQCNFLNKPSARFFTWQGKELPCVFMKNHTDFLFIEELRAKLLAGQTAMCCDGCVHLAKATT